MMIENEEYLTSSHSAKAWEESLTQVCALTNENVAKVVSLQRSRQPQSSQTFPLQLSRASSVPRSQKFTSQPGGKTLTSHSQSGNYPSQLLLPTTTTTTSMVEQTSERKVEYLLKRVKQLDDKIKKNERDTLCVHSIIQQNANDIEIVKKTVDDDISHIQSIIRDQQFKMKNLEHLQGQSRDASRERPLQSQPVDLVAIREYVFNSIRTDLTAVIQDVVRACAEEQAVSISTANALSTHAQNAFEKEIIKINAEAARLKTRQDALEGTYIDIRTSINAREKEAEQAHRRAISNYKIEMTNIVEALGRKVNEKIATLQGRFLHPDGNKLYLSMDCCWCLILPPISFHDSNNDFFILHTGSEEIGKMKQQLEQQSTRQDHAVSEIAAHLQLAEERIEEVLTVAQRADATATHALTELVDPGAQHSGDGGPRGRSWSTSARVGSSRGPSSGGGLPAAVAVAPVWEEAASRLDARMDAAYDSIASLQESRDGFVAGLEMCKSHFEKKVRYLRIIHLRPFADFLLPAIPSSLYPSLRSRTLFPPSLTLSQSCVLMNGWHPRCLWMQVDDLVQVMRGESKQQQDASSRVAESNKKIKGKMKELSAHISQVSMLRESVEQLLKDVTSRGHDEPVWSFQFNSALDRLDKRINGVEDTVRGEVLAQGSKAISVEAMAVAASSTRENVNRLADSVRSLEERLRETSKVAEAAGAQVCPYICDCVFSSA